MLVTLEEMKHYLRVDYPDDDPLLAGLLKTAEKLCRDMLRTEDDAEDDDCDTELLKTAVFYTTAYLYEHREEADHHELGLTLRALLAGERKEAF